MKKLLLSFMAISLSLALSAQLLTPPTPGGISEISKRQLSESFMTKAPTDTLGWSATSIPLFASPTANIYTLRMSDSLGGPGGYWFGVNYDATIADPYGVDYWGMAYVVGGNIGIEGVLMMVGGKTVNTGGASSYVEVMIYDLAADQTLTASGVTGVGPDAFSGTPLATANLLTDDIDTTWNPNMGFNYVPLSAVVPMSTDFAVVANFKPMRLANDTAYMLCDEPGNHGGLNYSFLCIDPSVYYWLTINYGTSGSYDVNMSLFVVIDANYVGINDADYFQGMKMTTSPNPTSDVLNLEYALQYDGIVKAQIINSNGQIVKVVEMGEQNASNYYKESIDVSDLASGNYFVSLMSNGNRLTKKVIIQ